MVPLEQRIQGHLILPPHWEHGLEIGSLIDLVNPLFFDKS
jgi:hypothetical protein